MVIPNRKGTLRLMILMITVPLVVTGIAIFSLHRVIVNEKKEYLKELSENQTAIINSIYAETKDADKALKFLEEQRKKNGTLGKSGEFYIGTLKNDSIFFLFDTSPSNHIAMYGKSDIGKPMKFALAKNKGFVKGLDYRNHLVLAYCNYIPEIKWGLVTKIEIAEINQPFYETALRAIVLSILLVIIATLVFRKISYPLVKRIVENEEKLRAILDATQESIYLFDCEGKFVAANHIGGKRVNRAPAELIGHHFSEFMPSELAASRTMQLNKVISTGKPLQFEDSRNGMNFEHHFFPCFKDGKVNQVATYSRDISEQKTKERELLRLNRILKALDKSSHAILTTSDEQSYLDSICNIVVNDCNFEMVWIGYAQHDERKSVKPMAFAGFDKGYLDTLNLTWSDDERGRGPTGTTIRTGKYTICHDMLMDPAFAPWREEAIKRGYASSIVFPIFQNDMVLGAITIYSSEQSPFTASEINLLTELTTDLSHGITSIRLKKANEEARRNLQKNEERYRLLVEMSPFGIYIHRNGRIVYLNPAAMKLFGIDAPEQIIGKTPFELFHPDSHDIVRNRIEQVLEGNIVVQNEEKIIRSDGEVRDVEVTASPFSDQEGTAIQVILRDVTETNLAREAINRYHLISKYARDPLMLVDATGTILEINEAAAALYGYSYEEFVGSNVRQLRRADDKGNIEQLIEKAKNEGVLVETIHVRKDGTEIPVEISSRGVHINGQDVLLTVVRDIRERKKAERELQLSKERLNLALENGNIGVWYWDLISNEIEWDERMEKIFGLKPCSFAGNYEAFERFLVEEDIPHVKNAVEKTLTDGLPFETVYRIRTSTDEMKYITAKALVTRDSDDIPVKMTGVCFDITDMKKGAEQALFQLNEELLRSNRELEQFAYVASHDLQEPLRMVSSFTQLLAQRYKDKLDQDAQDFINFAVDGALRMQVLINDLLSYSRIHTKGKSFSDVDFTKVLEKTLYNLSFAIQEKNAIITHDKLPVVTVDEDQMVQLLQNLVGNAIKFCTTQPEIHISSTETKDQFIISVKDNGIGIEPQYFERIFKIFQRLQPRETYDGTGIGLAICKRVIERHGGKIWVESELGIGTTFYFSINKSKKLFNGNIKP